MGQAGIDEIRKLSGGYFDLISIDGVDRCVCLPAAISKLKASRLLVVDKMDKNRLHHSDLCQSDAFLDELKGSRVHRLIGCSPDTFLSQETTVCSPANGVVKA
ncbi:MAG: hypothetical protein M3N41_09495 [Acidobacteriota bacterium]|nr:hypothetical protein [Acidobacteriota bacterium]